MTAALQARVQVSVHRRPDKTLYYQVEVWGAQFTRSSMQGILELGTPREAYAIAVLAGALAEELCTRLGDTLLDPAMAANTAAQTYRELRAENPHLLTGNELPREADGYIARKLGVVLHR